MKYRVEITGISPILLAEEKDFLEIAKVDYFPTDKEVIQIIKKWSKEKKERGVLKISGFRVRA